MTFLNYYTNTASKEWLERHKDCIHILATITW